MTPRSVRPLLAALLALAVPATLRAQDAARADSLYAAGDWAAAAEAYAAVTAANPEDGRAWLREGAARLRAGDPVAAREPLDRAAATFQPATYAHFFLAQTWAATGDAGKAVAELRQATGGQQAIPYPAIRSTFTSLAGDPDYEAFIETIKPCTADEYRQFDFWVGDWVVTNPAGQRAGTNSVTREYEGCLLVEHWQGAGGGAGTSQNFYDARDGKWHQNWIDSQAKGALWLSGGLDESGSMVMTDVEAGGDPANRITWTPNPDGTVRQHWEQSSDGGATWKTVFDGLYSPAAGDARE